MNFSSEKKRKNIKILGKVHEIRDTRLQSLQCQCVMKMVPCRKRQNQQWSTFSEQIPPRRIYQDASMLLFLMELLLRTKKNIPKTIGNISKTIMSIIIATYAPRVDIIFNQYCLFSIKD